LIRRIGAAVFFAAALASAAQAAVREEPVTYKDGDTVLKGFIVYDDATGAKRPGIIVVHEWWGITKRWNGSATRSQSWHPNRAKPTTSLNPP
jgi:hypothetical protein